MSEQQLSNLIKMLEQIIANNLHQGEAAEVAEVAATHVHNFWARSMKQLIINLANTHPEQLSTVALQAVVLLQAKSVGQPASFNP
ncbi:formate dehydrogenase subunit delta [Aliidiomarina quisquiliarum]|uniref:formate dehydrogenase subunit delta n=1 Tax=Aliidiomarina quisquiliarum TaxID=2938947 RepID=UPI00208F080F|nr:formate dehydrogenase subunit delta [Aliidiomarina quisquiliarum]